ncbi:RNA-directed DNA polymerase, eukaryota [Tanacetum coccineum]
MEQIDQIFVKSLWVRDNVDFASNGSIGASGGTLTIWNTSIFVKEGVLVGSSFSGAFGKWSGVNETIFLINIYGPQEDHSKEELWDELSCLIESRQGVWILFGNLNAVRYRSERAGSIFNSREASAFNEFIARNGLFDFPMGGIRFTRFSKNEEKRAN